MYTITDNFKAHLVKSHEMISRMDVLDSNKNVILGNIDIVSGSIQCDADSNIRRRATCEIVTNLPIRYTDYFHPLSGNEFRIYRGIRYSHGVNELIPQGVFGPITADLSMGKEGVSGTITGDDRGAEVEAAQIVDPYAVAIGTNYGTAIKNIIKTGRPARFAYNFATTTTLTPSMILEGGRWSKVQEMATSFGHELFFDAKGICVLRVLPTISTSPMVWDFNIDNDTMTRISKTISRVGTHNHVVVYGESPSNSEPVRGEAMDTNPASATYVGSPVGSSKFYSPTSMTSEYVTTINQANQLAKARLRQTLRARTGVSFEIVPNPALQENDVVYVFNKELRIEYLLMISKMNIPLGAEEAMSITVKEM